MDKSEIQSYKSKPERLKKLKALNAWCEMKCKSFRWGDALDVIYKAAEGNFDVIDDIIAHLTNKNKRYGKGGYMVGALPQDNAMDIRKGESGELELFGYNPSAPLTPKGQKVSHDNDGSYRKDGQRNRVYLNQKERLWDIGAYVRKLYPTADVIFIRKADQGFKEYCYNMHLKPETVYNLLVKGKLSMDSEGKITRPTAPSQTPTTPTSNNESVNRFKRVVIISEDMENRMKEASAPTEYQFRVKVRQFLYNLLVNPSEATVPDIFSMAGYTRSKLVKTLMDNKVIERSQKLVDTDENGEPRMAAMKVRYMVPKKDFDRKLKRVYIKMFERNVPDESIAEDAGCGACADGGATSASCSGQYSQPIFGVQRKMIANVGVTETTTTTTVGDIQYDAPAFLDDETADRTGGKEHSVSINHATN